MKPVYVLPHTQLEISEESNRDSSFDSQPDAQDEQELNLDEPPKKKRKILKCADDKIPLPEPFPLPKHYRSDVEHALQVGQMTRETTSSFITAITGAILVYKKYPTGKDLEMVARTIVRKYTSS